MNMKSGAAANQLPHYPPDVATRLRPGDPQPRRDGVKDDIKNLTLDELTSWLAARGEKPFRARQVFQWLYQHRAREFDEMTSVAKSLRNLLHEHFHVGFLQRKAALHSTDGSIKYMFGLADGREVETVLMPGPEHITLCVSTQVGCAMGCVFCMTARMGLVRNLSAGEIVQQVVEAYTDVEPGRFIRNIVFMGMGEPLHNYENVVKAIDTLCEDHGFGISARRITVSTSGLVPAIKRFIRDGVRANLAVSLNAVRDDLRTELMPVNRRWNVAALLDACRELPSESRIRLTFEYVLLKGVNDGPADARRLVKLLHGIKCKVNLIPYNPPPGLSFERPSPENVRRFQEILLGKGLLATVRISRGLDIQGACGQLITAQTPDAQH